jgi:hypothetical protein
VRGVGWITRNPIGWRFAKRPCACSVERGRQRTRREAHINLADAVLRVTGAPRVVTQDRSDSSRPFHRRLEENPIATALGSQSVSGILQPRLTGLVHEPVPLIELIEHDSTICNRGTSPIDDLERLPNCEGIQPRHQEDVMIAMRERTGLSYVPCSEKIGVINSAGNRQIADPRHLSIKQRELRIDARPGSVRSGRAGNPEGYPLGQDQIKKAVLQSFARDRRRDRQLYRAGVRGPVYGLFSRRPNSQDVRGR